MLPWILSNFIAGQLGQVRLQKWMRWIWILINNFYNNGVDVDKLFYDLSYIEFRSLTNDKHGDYAESC